MKKLALFTRYRLYSGAWSPASLFTGGVAGAWYDPSDVLLDWRTNLLTWTQEFDNAAWVTSAATITADSTTAPDGTTTADTITFSSVAGRIQRAVNMASQCISIYAKPIVGTRFAINTDGVSGADATVFNLSGSGSVVSTGANNNSSVITALPNGWYRISTARGSTAGTNIYLGALNSGGGSTDSFYIWGAQLELGSTATTYQAITTPEQTYLLYDPQPVLYQDSAGTTPVTAVEQPVGLMLDKSQGLATSAELVPDYDFATPASWTPETADWVVSGGKATYTKPGAGVQYLQSNDNISIVSGTWYRLTFTISGIASGNAIFGLFNKTASTNYLGGYQTISANGTYTIYFLATSSTTGIRIYGNAGGTATSWSFESFGIKSYAGNHASQATAASRPVLRARYNLLTYSNVFENAAWTKSNSFVQQNLLLYSQEFDNAAWTTITANSVVTPNTTISPDGTLTADTFASDAATSQHFATQSPSLSATTTYTFSVYGKTASTQFLQITTNLTAGSAQHYATFDLTAGTVSQVGSSATASIQSVGNGWYRCICTMTTVSASAANTILYCVVPTGTGGRNPLYTGSTSVYIWGAQLVQGSVPGDYRATTSAALPVLYADYNGSLRARKLCENTTATIGHRVQQNLGTLTGSAFTFSEYIKAGERTWAYLRYDDLTTTNFVWFNLATGAVGSTSMSGATIISGSISNAGNGYYRCTATVTNSGFTSTVFGVGPATGDANQTYTGDGSSGIYIADAQLWQGSVPGNYQNINAATDYATAGFLPYLALDGTDDSFGTNSIDFSATDKMFVCVGITKLSDAVSGTVVDQNGVVGTAAFMMRAPSGAVANYAFFSGGTTGFSGAIALGYAAPITNVVSGIGNISGDQEILRVNGAQVAISTVDQGTGNYSNLPIYIGRRQGTQLPLNGRIYQMVVCGKTLSASELASTEAYVNSKTGAY